MNKPALGVLLGGILGVFDGLTALISAPEVKSQMLGIILGSMGKGLLAGLIIGWFAKRRQNLALGVIVGLLVGAALALPFALPENPETGKQYFWEILIPGALVGMIVGYATQQYGRRPTAA